MPVLIEKRNLNGLIIDGTITESHSGSATVTSHPVAASSPISDHMYSNQKEVTIVGTISDMPLACAPPLSRPRYLSNPTEHEFENIPILKQISEDRRELFLNILGLDDNEIAAIQENTSLFSDDGFFAGELDSDIQNALNEIGVSNFGSSGSSFDFDFSSLPEGARTSAALCRAYELMENKETITLVTGLKVYENMVVTSVSTETNENRTNKIELSITLREIKRVSARSAVINQLATSGKGSKNRGKVDPDCLRLDQVFIDRAASDTTNGDLYLSRLRAAPSSETIDISVSRDNIYGVYSPFNKVAYQERICGRISARYVIPGSVVGESRENLTAANNLIQELCERIYIEENCNIPRACNESIYNPIQDTTSISDGTPNNNSIFSPLFSSTSNAINRLNQTIGGYEENIRDVAVAPTQQVSSQGSPLFIPVAGGFEAGQLGISVEDARLECYYQEVLRRFQTTTINGVGISQYLIDVRLGLRSGELPPSTRSSRSSIPPDTSN